MSTTYVRPQLYGKQERAFFTPKRYSLIEASTKAGKTVGAIAWILEQAFAGTIGQNYWWVAPVSSQSDIAYRRVQQGLTRGAFTKSDSPTPKIGLMNGATVWFKSGDNPDSLFGEDVYAAVVDEASRVKEESWHALRSTLTATQGPVRIIGNVKGRKNWFYRLARLAESEVRASSMHYERITVLDAIEAGVIPPDEIEDARATLPEKVFQELYMAEPGDDSGNPFGLAHITACAGPLSTLPAVAFGVDLAKKQDFFVIIGLDEFGAVCIFERWQGIPWPESIRRVQEIVGDTAAALIDSTGVGDPVLDTLQEAHGNFDGYVFTAPSKQKLMEGLAVSIQSHELTFPDGPIKLELENFEYEYTRTGVRYSAPEGLHDDCVCALALARHKWAETVPGAALMTYYAQEARRARTREHLTEVGLGEQFVQEVHHLARSTEDASSILTNELTALYERTLREHSEPAKMLCAHCFKPITDGNRVTDGVFSWHPACAGGGLRIAA